MRDACPAPAGPACTAFREAERVLLARRAGAPDIPAALEAALAAVPGAARAGFEVAAARRIAAAAEAFGAALPAGSEPAYHDRHHQAETVLVMGWLCARALAAGRLTPEEALVGIAGMAAHDLRHPGRPNRCRNELEHAAAAEAAALAAAAGAAPGWCEALRGVVLATAMPQPGPTERVPLLHRLAHEADIYASALPQLGRRLSRAIADELRAAGEPDAEVPATHAGRLAFLSAIPEPTEEAAALGLGCARAVQFAAYARCAAELGLPPTAEAGAAALDRLDRAAADARLDAALAGAAER